MKKIKDKYRKYLAAPFKMIRYSKRYSAGYDMRRRIDLFLGTGKEGEFYGIDICTTIISAKEKSHLITVASYRKNYENYCVATPFDTLEQAFYFIKGNYIAYHHNINETKQIRYD